MRSPVGWEAKGGPVHETDRPGSRVVEVRPHALRGYRERCAVDRHLTSVACADCVGDAEAAPRRTLNEAVAGHRGTALLLPPRMSSGGQHRRRGCSCREAVATV
jgi:hypothetical protein